MQASVNEWVMLLAAIGGTLKAKKCYWDNPSYIWDSTGAWNFACNMNQDLTVLILDGT